MEYASIIILYLIIFVLCYGIVAWQVDLFRKRQMGFWSILAVAVLGLIGMVLVHFFGKKR